MENGKIILFKLKNGRYVTSIILLIFLCKIVTTSFANAADRYWVADNDGTDKFWHDNANWSKTSGGSGGWSAPTRTGDKAFFDNGSTVDVKLGANVTKINQLRVTGTYTGTINLNGYKLGSKNKTRRQRRRS